MGANLCSCRHSSSSVTDHHDNEHDDHNHAPNNYKQEHKELTNQTVKANKSTSTPWSLMMGLTCLGITDDHDDDKKRKPLLDQVAGIITPKDIHEKKISKKTKNLNTLEDWLMDSPVMINNNDKPLGGGELHVFKHCSSRKVHPSSSSSSSSSKIRVPPRSSFSSTSLLGSKAIDSIALEPKVKSSVGFRNVSGGRRYGNDIKSTKKVSFREELDIVIFCSPDESELCFGDNARVSCK